MNQPLCVRLKKFARLSISGVMVRVKCLSLLWLRDIMRFAYLVGAIEVMGHLALQRFRLVFFWSFFPQSFDLNPKH